MTERAWPRSRVYSLPVSIQPSPPEAARAQGRQVAGSSETTTRRRTGGASRPYEHDRAHILRRLSRIEGQVRGISRMIEREDECVDVMQQTAALRAAVDAVTMLLMEDHLHGCLARAVASGDGEAVAEEVMEVLRRGMGRPVRAGRGTVES